MVADGSQRGNRQVVPAVLSSIHLTHKRTQEAGPCSLRMRKSSWPCVQVVTQLQREERWPNQMKLTRDAVRRGCSALCHARSTTPRQWELHRRPDESLPC